MAKILPFEYSTVKSKITLKYSEFLTPLGKALRLYKKHSARIAKLSPYSVPSVGVRLCWIPIHLTKKNLFIYLFIYSFINLYLFIFILIHNPTRGNRVRNFQQGN
jgi:hypothetical protein